MPTSAVSLSYLILNEPFSALEFFAQTPVHPLPPIVQFIGSGVYSLYYRGDYELYAKISDLNQNDQLQPIYVGKAVSQWLDDQAE